MSKEPKDVLLTSSEPEAAIVHFPDEYINAIDIDPMNNYFTPVWDIVLGTISHFDPLIDVACGNGLFTIYIKERTNCKLYGVDGSRYAINQAKAYGFETIEPIRDFNYDKLPFNDATFEFCLCKDLLEHLVNPEFVLSEMYRVLRPGGHLLLHVPNHFTLYGRLKFLFTNDIDTYKFFKGADRWNFPHIRYFTYENLVQLLHLKGFSVMSDLSYHFPGTPLLHRLLVFPQGSRWLMRRYPSQFAAAFTLLLKKT